MCMHDLKLFKSDQVHLLQHPAFQNSQPDSSLKAHVNNLFCAYLYPLYSANRLEMGVNDQIIFSLTHMNAKMAIKPTQVQLRIISIIYLENSHQTYTFGFCYSDVKGGCKLILFCHALPEKKHERKEKKREDCQICQGLILKEVPMDRSWIAPEVIYFPYVIPGGILQWPTLLVSGISMLPSPTPAVLTHLSFGNSVHLVHPCWQNRLTYLTSFCLCCSYYYAFIFEE